MRRLTAFIVVATLLATAAATVVALGPPDPAAAPFALVDVGPVCDAPAAGHTSCAAVFAGPTDVGGRRAVPMQTLDPAFTAAKAATTTGKPTTTTVRATTTTAKAPTTTVKAPTTTAKAPATTVALPPPPPSSGLTPADLRAAYRLSGGGAGQTVAVVVAGDDPVAEADLGIYRAQFGLGACTTANGCFRKLNQTGTAASFPGIDTSWAAEGSLDLDMVSAVCPGCKLILMEANSSYSSDMFAAERAAAAAGATVISNSWGAPDFAGADASYGASLHFPGVAVVAATGDGGYGMEYPAASQWVTAVGGTTLRKAPGTARGYTETAWSGAGSGCTHQPRPAWQTAPAPAVCTNRAGADVAAVADPATPVDVYDSLGTNGWRGWLLFGGTSAATPVVAAVYALAGDYGQGSGASRAYSHPQGLFDVTSGSNGSCSNTTLCKAGPGWDGPTGLGSPNGLTAF